MALKYTENKLIWKQDKLRHEVLFLRPNGQCSGQEKEPNGGGGDSPQGRVKGMVPG